MTEIVEIDLVLRSFVYRLWGQGDNCLYVGQHHGLHPVVRIKQHKAKPWWPEVVRADYMEIDGNLDKAEQEQIDLLKPRYNVARAFPRLFPKPSGGERLHKRLGLMTFPEAAQAFNLSVENVRRITQSHQHLVEALGLSEYIKRQEFEDYLTEHMMGSNQ